jgi:hypothetical protein
MVGDAQNTSRDGWPASAKFVLEELKRLNRTVGQVVDGQNEIKANMRDLCTRTELQKVKDDVQRLKAQAGVWGGVFGFASSIVAGLIQWLIRGGG